jgi:hypothetical protein
MENKKAFLNIGTSFGSLSCLCLWFWAFPPFGMLKVPLCSLTPKIL